MKITEVCCQGCSADLEVSESIRYVTCNYCHARHEVLHDPTEICNCLRGNPRCTFPQNVGV